ERIAGRWTRCATYLIVGRYLAIAFDPGRARTVLHAGYGPLGVSNLTREWAGPTDQLPPTLLAQPQPLTVRAGQSATFSAPAEGTEPLCYQWLYAPPGAHEAYYVHDGARFNGATTPTLTIRPVERNDEAAYRLLVRS